MKVSVVGDKKIGVCIARLLKKKGFDLVSYHCDDVEACVKNAVLSNCKAYVDLKRTIEESEAVFIAMGGGLIKRFMRRIAAFHPKNKIFCAIGGEVSSDMLNIGNENTYFSVFVPMYALYEENFSDISDTTLFFEGFGRDCWDFYDVLYINNVKFRFVEKEQKSALMLAATLVTDFSSALSAVASDILQKSDLDTSWLMALASASAGKKCTDNGEFNLDTKKAVSDFANINSDTAHKLSSVVKFLEIMKINYFN